MNSIFCIGWKGASEFDFEDKKHEELQAFKDEVASLEGNYFQPGSNNDQEALIEIEEYTKKNFSENNILVSQDHAVTFSGLKKLNEKNLGLIVFDQHIDLYSYQSQGEDLNRANIFRKAFDENLVKHIVFVGVRNSEQSLLEEDKSLPIHIQESSQKDRQAGILSGFDEKISIIQMNSFSDGIKQALDLLNNKEITKVGIDIDLDVFNSDEILGVEYNIDAPKKIIKKFLNENGNQDLNFLLEIEDYKELETKLLELKTKNLDESIQMMVDDALWYLQENSEEGMSPEITISNQELKEILNQNSQDLIFRGITEWIPSNDLNGKTNAVVKKLIDILS